MDAKFMRTGLVLGAEKLELLKGSSVAVYGVGGVGSFAVEALARAGIGRIMITDPDTVDISNINRQLPATTKTVGRLKVDVMEQRILDINPEANVITKASDDLSLLLDGYDYIIDAVDTVTTKLNLTQFAYENHINIISCMGAGNKLDPTLFKVADIYSTSVCPLCRVMRRELKRRSIPALKTVYSEEKPIKPDYSSLPEVGGVKGGSRMPPGSVSFVPPVVGMIAAGEVIKDLTK